MVPQSYGDIFLELYIGEGLIFILSKVLVCFVLLVFVFIVVVEVMDVGLLGNIVRKVSVLRQD